MLQRILRILRRGRFESDLDAELRDHMQKYRDDLVSRGVPAQEAELRARREFGRIIAVKEDVRESSGLAWADTAARNFRYAFRVLRKNHRHPHPGPVHRGKYRHLHRGGRHVVPAIAVSRAGPAGQNIRCNQACPRRRRRDLGRWKDLGVSERSCAQP